MSLIYNINITKTNSRKKLWLLKSQEICVVKMGSQARKGESTDLIPPAGSTVNKMTKI